MLLAVELMQWQLPGHQWGVFSHGIAAAPAGADESPSDPDPRTANVPGAKEGFVGAYDLAADAASSLKNAISHLTSSQQASHSASHTRNDAPPAAAAPAGGNADVSSGKGGVMSALQQGWEDLKHGGAKAPHVVSTAGETAAAHDVTSNIERSKQLGDPQQAKIYNAEVYHVSPGAQSSSAQASTNQGKAAGSAGAVAGDNRPVTGAEPHGKPGSSRVDAGQTTRFSGDKGISTSFGTGSAAPWTGDDSIKAVAALFNTTSHLGQPQQQVEAEVAATADGGRAHQGAHSWVGSFPSWWSHFGRASAKGPTGNQVMKDIK
eukprot:gene2826-3119_t